MLRRNGVEVAVPVATAVFLVFVKRRPSAFQLAELGFRDKVPRLAVSAELVVPHKRPFLAGAEFVHHPADPAAEFVLEGRIVRAREGERQGRHVVASTVAFEFRGRGIPTGGLGVSIRGQSVGIAVIIKHLGNVQRQEVPYVQVAVGGEPVVADEPDAPERQRPGDRLLRRHRRLPRNHGHAGLHRESVFRSIVPEDKPLHGIDRS